MKMEHHMLVTAPIAAGTYYFTHSWLYAGMALFLGFLVDVDHILDYVREEGKFDLKDLFVKSYEGDFRYFYCIFHAWEYIPLAWIAGALMHNYVFPVVFTIAYTAHMLPDQLLNNTRPPGYFIIYRMIIGFEMSKIFYPPKGRKIPKSKVKSQKSKVNHNPSPASLRRTGKSIGKRKQ